MVKKIEKDKDKAEAFARNLEQKFKSDANNFYNESHKRHVENVLKNMENAQGRYRDFRRAEWGHQINEWKNLY